MLQLYFYPMACSLSSRIALMEAGIDARYHPVASPDQDRSWTTTATFRAMSPKGAVPVLVLENGERLTEGAAVLQYIADLKPEARPCAARSAISTATACRNGSASSGPRFTRRFCFRPSGTGTTHRSRAAREGSAQSVVGGCHASIGPRLSRRRPLHGRRCPSHLGIAAARPRRRRLAQWPHLVAYRDRIQTRRQVKAAIEIEMALLKTIAA